MSTDELRPPFERVEFSSNQEDETEDFIRRNFVGNRTRFLGSADAARFRAETVIGPSITADRIRSTVDYSLKTDPFGYFTFVSVHGGRMQFSGAGWEEIALPGHHCVYPSDVGLDVSAFAIDGKILRVSADRLKAAAGESGCDDEPFRFSGLTPASAAMARYWSAVVDLTHGALLGDERIGDYPLLLEGLTNTVAITALHTFPNTSVMRPAMISPGRVGVSALQRAVAFIDAHAQEPITLADIALAAGISVRGLQFAFARHRDTTPTQYLRLVRLTHAHHELELADPFGGVTVEEVAKRWGFVSPSRFAAHYRDAFGILPNQTLRS